MWNKILSLVLGLISIICVEANGYAKTYAWIIDIHGKASKIDVDSNENVQTINLNGNPNISLTLQEASLAIVADSKNNLLAFVNDFGRVGHWVSIYNLKDLSFNKKLELESRDPRFELPRIIMPPSGNKFYVIWWDISAVNGLGGERCSVYDKTSLSKINDLATFPVDYLQPMGFSSDGLRLFSINLDKDEIKVYDGGNLQLLETISIAGFWDAPLFGKNIEYFNKGNALFAENLKASSSEPNFYKYFVYNTVNKNISKKINVKEPGSGVFTPDMTKLIIVESLVDAISIYDIVTAQKIKRVDFSGKYKDVRAFDLTTITPSSSKLYLQGENLSSDVTTLLIVDLTSTYSLIAEIPGIEGSALLFVEQ